MHWSQAWGQSPQTNLSNLYWPAVVIGKWNFAFFLTAAAICRHFLFQSATERAFYKDEEKIRSKTEDMISRYTKFTLAFLCNSVYSKYILFIEYKKTYNTFLKLSYS